MGSFVFQSTEIEGLRLVAPMFHRDRRGYFSKTFEREAFAAHGVTLNAVEGVSYTPPALATHLRGVTSAVAQRLL